MKRNFLLPNNDQLICTHQAAIFTFSAPRMVLSTAANGGGLRYDLTSTFNYCDCGPSGVCLPMNGKNLKEHQISIAKRLGLDPEYTTGLDTAANLDNMVVLTKAWNSISITAAVSAGADVNALCAGDPATLFESDGEPCILSPGTINIFLITNQTLSPGAMTELLMTITEAKTTVLRDFMQGSSASNSIATGTGTDGIVIIGDCDFEHTLLNAGKHFKFGELAALTVQGAVKEALFRQTGFCAQSQHSVFSRLKRFGISKTAIVNSISKEYSLSLDAISALAEHFDKDSFCITAVSLYIHLLDQCRSDMLTVFEISDWSNYLLQAMKEHYSCNFSISDELDPLEKLQLFFESLLRNYIEEEKHLYSNL